MDTAIKTVERWRNALNGNQPSRERLCTGILGLDRNYTNIKPRGPDGGRDIECHWMGQICFGAVGFQNNVSDSPEDKRNTIFKFEDDVISTRKANKVVKAFVFFCNTDLSHVGKSPTAVVVNPRW